MGQIIFGEGQEEGFGLGERTAVGLNERMPVENAPNPLFESLAGYPEWLVAACLTIVAAVAIWVIAKVLKWSLYLLMILVLVGGVAATVWLVFN